MREKYINNIISSLIKEYGFSLEEYNTAEDNSKNLLAIKYENENAFVVTFSTKEDFANKSFLALEYMREKGIKALSLNNIIIDKFTNDHLDILENQNYNFIILDSDNGGLVGSSDQIKNFAGLISKLAQNDKSGNTKKRNLKKSINEYKATYTLIGINIFIFMISAYLSKSIFDIDIKVLLLLGAKNNQLINAGQYYRLFMAMFLHGGLLHLGLNMYALRTTGEIVESFYGRKKFLIIYFLSGITSSLASYIFSQSTSVGASGAIFGLLGACLIFAYKMKEKIGKEFLRNILSVIVVNILIGATIPNIDNFGHLGGLVGGLIISFILFKE
ncbi:rhomboid family intramembrane serine protease [Clostridium algidicarnis]|uniref:Rhomboid protease GluP n=1 Tax=Clostridium algidicarnis DSM 15099 TaxID=1121295 RepID=A0A2S6FWD4_9CLOT|nr:rhomboid family intramembrane serine protease [Clostridium algidicarnis]PPK47895.1 rhomboid protease GluP [Clostridium algidicarnis DSM 15099]